MLNKILVSDCFDTTTATSVSYSISSTTSITKTSTSTSAVVTPTNQTSISTTNQYLIHYWPISNNTMTDSISNADMHQGITISFASDRFECPMSALNLNGGYTYVQEGFYFDSTEFTISVWVYPQSVGLNARVIDFGNGASSDNIILTQADGFNLFPLLYIFSGSTNMGSVISKTSLALSQWQFLVATFDGTLASIYIDGVLQGQSSLTYTLPKLIRSNNFIGKSNWNDGYSSSHLDDLRFYNKCLNQLEIIDLMNENCKKFSFYNLFI